MAPAFGFEVTARDGAARLGRLATPHGEAATPLFMPVATQGSVKGIAPDRIGDAGAQVVLANAYHLGLRPGCEVVEKMGGLASFISWDGPTLTDSGGYQVFSLGKNAKICKDAVVFRSHIDGAEIVMTPERSIEIQERLGPDIAMAFDQFPPYPCEREYAASANERTARWARACIDARGCDDQALFGIVQGGIFRDLREASAREIAALPFDGFALGGLGMGEGFAVTGEVIEWTAPLLPEDRPRYLMGVGSPPEIVEASARGIDMFDCVMPTRNGRNATAFTDHGKLRLRNASMKTDERPIDTDCDCFTCRTFTRSYIRHLFHADEMLGPILVALHNVAYYARLMRRIREAIEFGVFDAMRERIAHGYGVDFR